MSKRNRLHPPASPRDAEREGDVPHFETVEDLNAFFRCRHGNDITTSSCELCTEEAMERMDASDFWGKVDQEWSDAKG